MRVLLDECVPSPLAKQLHDVTVETTSAMGWASKKNGELIELAEKEFDVFITSDQNLVYQQNLTGRNIAILLLPTNRWKILAENIENFNNAVRSISTKEFKILKW